jgi:flagellar hook assembly protein FlgD
MVYAVTGEGARVEIGVYDIAGRQMRVLAEGVESVGRHSVTWDGRDNSGAHVRKGMYFVRIQIGNQARQVRVTSVN